MYAIARAIDAAGRPAPNTAAASTASRIPGNANKMSRPDEITASTRPRRQAAITASRVPASRDPITTASGPSMDDVAPANSRDSTSLPSTSKPSRCPPVGPTQGSDGCTRVGLNGAISGPMTAMTVAIAITTADARTAAPVARSRPTAPRRARGSRTVTSGAASPARARDISSLIAPCSPLCSLRAPPRSLRPAPECDPGVKHRVGEVDGDVNYHERGDEHQRDALHHGEVLVLCRGHQVRAEAVQAERGL